MATTIPRIYNYVHFRNMQLQIKITMQLIDELIYNFKCNGERSIVRSLYVCRMWQYLGNTAVIGSQIFKFQLKFAIIAALVLVGRIFRI